MALRGSETLSANGESGVMAAAQSSKANGVAKAKANVIWRKLAMAKMASSEEKLKLKMAKLSASGVAGWRQRQRHGAGWLCGEENVMWASAAS